ncbi:hypothetical protein N7471_010600 [Penicillium samsonianum]|uniref:uncharacterized protein n=1 Tax=Penicillium samsonianum TaxID=1882272 RepID=UPI002546A44A|nr:uncharacterized protein N7471_010600 [Penicillium samsonianum]KAJ6126107.1 hypothetical protein N7471_010600 [Penicillium samsonianum]
MQCIPHHLKGDGQIVLIHGIFANGSQGTTFGNHLFKDISPAVKPSIQISCEPKGQYYFYSRYPAEKEMTIGFLNWINFRDRDVRRNLRVENIVIENSSEASEATNDIIQSMMTPSHLKVYKGREEVKNTFEVEPIERLLQFSKMLVDKGHANMESGDAKAAKNAYHAALYSLSEWEAQRGSNTSGWANISFETLASLCEIHAHLKQAQEALETAEQALRLDIAFTDHPENRWPSLLKCANSFHQFGDHRRAFLVAMRARQLQPENTAAIDLVQSLLPSVTSSERSFTKLVLDTVGRVKIELPLATKFNQDESCVICLQHLSGEVTQLPNCKHYFHRLCVWTWLSRQRSCPLCRVGFQ